MSGIQDKGAIGQARVRNLEVRLVNDLVPVDEDIEIEGAGAVGDGCGAVAAEFALDPEQMIEKLARRQV